MYLNIFKMKAIRSFVTVLIVFQNITQRIVEFESGTCWIYM